MSHSLPTYPAFPEWAEGRKKSIGPGEIPRFSFTNSPPYQYPTEHMLHVNKFHLTAPLAFLNSLRNAENLLLSSHVRSDQLDTAVLLMRDECLWTAEIIRGHVDHPATLILQYSLIVAIAVPEREHA